VSDCPTPNRTFGGPCKQEALKEYYFLRRNRHSCLFMMRVRQKCLTYRMSFLGMLCQTEMSDLPDVMSGCHSSAGFIPSVSPLVLPRPSVATLRFITTASLTISSFARLEKISAYTREQYFLLCFGQNCHKKGSGFGVRGERFGVRSEK